MSKVFAFNVLSAIFIFTSLQLQANCIVGNCINGKGTYLFKDGSKYQGQFSKGKAHGQGTYFHKDGATYAGAFTSGVKHGVGKLTFSSKDVYEGNFVNGVINGIGKMKYRNGDIYIGDWYNGKPSGMGKYIFCDGDLYQGEFVNGMFSGKGKLARKDGSYYDGQWLNNKKDGVGIAYNSGKKIKVIYDANALIREQSLYSHIHPQINTLSTNKTNKIIDCNTEFCHNVVGSYRYKDGSVYSGQFTNGKGEGNGTCKYANGDKYEGEWKNHAPHGQGTMIFAKGNTFTALWDNGVPTKKFPSSYDGSHTSKTMLASGDKKTKIYALIAGVATYNHMPSLKYTDDDAYQLYAFLKSPEGGAIPDPNIKVIIDEAVTRQSLIQEMHSITSKADEDDVILIYLSGHGLDGSFIPSDFDGLKNQVSYEDILEILNSSKAKHKLFITDACHSGSVTVAARTPFNVALENFYSAYNTTDAGTAIMLSSKKEEVSLEYGGLRQGIFSHYLIKGLKGQADANNDKLITISELYNYISSNVKSYTASAQNPVIMGDYDKNMPVGWVRQY